MMTTKHVLHLSKVPPLVSKQNNITMNYRRHQIVELFSYHCLYSVSTKQYSSLASLPSSSTMSHCTNVTSSRHTYYSKSTIHKCFYSNTPPILSNKNDNDNDENNSPNNEINTKNSNIIIYKGPFASLSKRLKRISITTAIASIIGIPTAIILQSTGDAAVIPAVGQIAVGSTAILAATGSTAALSFVFGPYVNTLEYINKSNHNEDSDDDMVMVKVTTCNIFGMDKETIFNPKIDIRQPSSSYRPFCNFLIRNDPFYIHPELLDDEKLRIQLLGEELGRLGDDGNCNDEERKKKNKELDDDFL